MSIVKVKEQQNLVPTNKYPYAKFPFEFFNPVQSRVFESYDKDVNYIVASSTSSGKTISAELFLAHEIRKRGGKGMYLSPIKALAQEKIDDWTSPQHHFSDINLSICTGDYRLTAQRTKEIEQSDVIIMTDKMLNSKCRNHRTENNKFIQDIKTLVIDESHGISNSGGDHLESGLMKFSEINPDARLVLLSATMPNVDEMGSWLSSLNGKDTIILQSDYRPCKLFIHYVKYYDVKWNYDKNELEKISTAIKIIKDHPKDKFIIFVHTKKTGKILAETLEDIGIKYDYHNADLPKEKRVAIEKGFREDPKLRCLVATYGMSQGINCPARRVIILGVHRGLSEVSASEIIQECGRSGRPQYDPQGDAYILLPQSSFEKQKQRIQEPQLIQSQILDNKCLAFHLTSEIHHRNIQSDADVYDWYERSLAHHQSKQLDENIVTQVTDRLTKCKIISKESGSYDITTIGMVASMFYFSPFDVSDLNSNWRKVFDIGKQDDDYFISMALANIDTFRSGVVSNADKAEIETFRGDLYETCCNKLINGNRDFLDGAIRAGYCYYNLLNGKNSVQFGALMQGLKSDFERVSEVLSAIDEMGGKWNQKEYFKNLYLRILYGVGEELIELCHLKGIGKVKAKRLWDANLRTLEQVSDNVLGVIKALGCSKKVAEDISNNAKSLRYV